MDKVSTITLLNHPIVWIKDKHKNGLNNTGLYLITLLPAIPIMLGLISDLVSLFGLSFFNSSSDITLLWFLFIYGLLNLWFIYIIQQIRIRLNRNYEIFSVIHKKIICDLKDYNALKKSDIKLTRLQISEYIGKLLDNFNEHYMKRVYLWDISACIKYKVGNTLTPIRVGNNKQDRNNNDQDVEGEYVYSILSKPGKKLNFIYIKNLKDDKTDKYENAVLGNNLSDIIIRANGKYRSFIALPIRSGTIPQKSGQFSARPDLGMIGFDVKQPYGFGNFNKGYAFDIIASFTDLISEPVQDLIECINNEKRSEGE